MSFYLVLNKRFDDCNAELRSAYVLCGEAGQYFILSLTEVYMHQRIYLRTTVVMVTWYIRPHSFILLQPRYV